MFEKFIKKFVDDSAYYSDFDFVTNSQLGKIAVSPAHYQHYKDNPSEREETRALIFGRAFHLCILEKDKFDELVVMEPKMDKRTKDGKAMAKEFAEENEGKLILTPVEWYSLIGMRNRIYSCNEATELLSKGTPEDVMVWEDPDTNVLCKCKADWVNLEDGYIMDIKTTQDATPRGFRNSAYKWGYDRQSAFYSDAFGVKNFIFIVIEKSAPYNIGVYSCGDDFMSGGRAKYKHLLGMYKDYFVEENKEPYEFTWIDEL
jgi:hypothetical protein